MFRRHFNAGSSRPDTTKTPALSSWDLLFGRRRAQPDDAVDSGRAKWCFGPAALHGGNVLPGRFSDRNRFADVLRGPLLPAWFHLSSASSIRIIFRCGRSSSPNNVLPGDVCCFNRSPCLCGVPRGLFLPGLRDVRTEDLRGRDVPISGRQCDLSPVSSGHLFDREW